MNEKVQRFDQFAILKLMGHKRLAGRVTEETIGGAAMLRIDIPKTSARPEYTKYFGTQAVYCITPCSEDLARRAAEEIERYNDPIPIHIPETRQLASGAVPVPAQVVADSFDGLDEDDDYGDDDEEDYK